jgi:hypothetical protein
VYETEYPGYRESLIPVVDSFYRNLSLNIYKEKLPIIAMFFSMGFIFWIFALLTGYIVCRRGIKGVLPYIMPFMTWATLLLGPTYLPRYIFFMWMIILFIIGDAYKNN